MAKHSYIALSQQYFKGEWFRLLSVRVTNYCKGTTHSLQGEMQSERKNSVKAINMSHSVMLTLTVNLFNVKEL